MGPKVKRITNTVKFGDNPFWDVQTQSLYFVDVCNQSIHRFYPALKKHTTVFIGSDYVSMILPLYNKNCFIINAGNHLIKIFWNEETNCMVNGQRLLKISNIPNRTEKFYLYNAKCDASGRIWALLRQESQDSSFEPGKTCLVSVEGHKNIKMHFVRSGHANGFTWNPNHTKFYYADPQNRVIEQFDFDLESGAIAKKSHKIVFSFKKYSINGYPSGITTDSDGNLWITVFNGYHVIKINPRVPDTLLETIPLPAKQLTNLVFGGPCLDKVYVTSASLTLNDNKELLPPYHGSTYVISNVGTTGLPTAFINKF